MTQPCRLGAGGRINRARPLRFRFNGKSYEGYSGDTLASALLANGVKVVSRSFKFHRPRGVFSAGVEESNALLGVDTGTGMIPVSRATQVPLIDGLIAESQNCFPSLRFDIGRVLDYTRPLWPAGFYNKTFKWPRWQLFEGFIRHMAGLGRLPDGDDSTHYRHMNAHCDVLVVGAGPAGLRAALDAGRRGDDVILVEQDVEAGGSLLYDRSEIDGPPTGDWLQEKLAELAAMDNVCLMLRATVAGYYDHNVVTIHDRSYAWRGKKSVETFWKVRAHGVVLATGAIEQPLLFGNNDLPGVMLAGAVQQYSSRYAVQCGKRTVGVINNDLGWQSILATHDVASNVAGIIDLRPSVSEELREQAEQFGIELHLGASPTTARGSFGVKAIRFLSADGALNEIECDAIAMSGGVNPTAHLYSQAGGKLRYDDQLACFVPHKCRQNVEVVGAAAGDFVTPGRYNIAARKPSAAKSNTQWVDLQHDVTVSDIELAVRENFISVEHLKRYTTTGMSVDQGKTSNLNALTLLGQLTDRQPDEVGTTTFRPQFAPVSMGAVAGDRRGDRYVPPRLLPAHDWHEKHNAAFEDYGGWQRPAFYGDDRERSIQAEAGMVRQSAGLFDGSPLGKIEIKGPDAAEFLNRIYVNTVPTLKPGKVRYGLMLNENGIIMDDGVFVRIADDHFLVNTTSGGAGRIAAWLEEWHQCEWPDLQLVLVSVTSQWAVSTVTGPKSREILQMLPGIIDLSTESFPHMSFAEARFNDGTPYRIQRVSYSGEQSFELSVPSGQSRFIFAAILAAGQPHGLGLLGVEALMVLRTEKGFLHVGADTDGTTNLNDVGFGGIAAKKKSDFVGGRSLLRANDQRADRRQLVGFEAVDKHAAIRVGAHFVSIMDNVRRSEGFVTSACMSPILNKIVGLGLIERGFDRTGEKISVFDDGRIVAVRIVTFPFFDPDGDRMRG